MNVPGAVTSHHYDHEPLAPDTREGIRRQAPRRLDCGHLSTPPSPEGGAAGYATTATGRTVCYRCADEHEREAMAAAAIARRPFTAYLDTDGRHVTTWTGGHLARVTHERSRGRGFDGSTLTAIRATDAQGRRWYGRGAGRGMVINLRPTKEQPR